MNHSISHYFLVHSQSPSPAQAHVIHYLQNNQLIRYAEFFVNENEILSAAHKRFPSLLDEGIAKNREFSFRMLEHLREEGIDTLEQLLDLEQGYETKILHTLTHMLDGFIGIDSFFYNLIEDSHTVSRTLKNTISEFPNEHWLVPVRTGKPASSLLHL